MNRILMISNVQHERPAKLSRTARRWVVLHVGCLLVVAVFFRAWQIDHVPGLNGDEAWMGVQAQRLLQGEAVTWQTPTGNPMNPFLFFPLVALHAMFEPSIALLRLPALVAGVLALGVNYWFSRRILGQPLAVISTLILAVLPINIAYARFGWDASETLLMTLPVVYLPLWAVVEPARRVRYLGLAVVALFAALLVHPTNIFVAPLIAVAALYCFRHELKQLSSRVRRGGWFGRTAVAVSLLLSVSALGLLWPWCQLAAKRLITPGQGRAFLTHYIDLFSGTSVYRYIPGSLLDPSSAWTVAYQLAAGVIFTLAIWGVVCLLRNKRDVPLQVLSAGWLSSVVGFFLIAGPEAIEPNYERYGICLIAPGALLLSWGMTWWLGLLRGVATSSRPSVRVTHPARWAVPMLAWALLASFAICYFGQFRATGGESHRAFRTGSVEPKLAAYLRAISQDPGQPITIVTDRWWNYWPLEYFSHGREDVQVIRDHDLPLGKNDPPGSRWYLGFDESLAEKHRDLAGAIGQPGQKRSSCFDFSGRPVVSLWRLSGSSNEPRGVEKSRQSGQ